MGIISSGLLIISIIAKWASSDEEMQGHFGMPPGTFGIWNIFMILLLIAIIFGELMLPKQVLPFIAYFPLLLSRSGRAALLLFVFFETVCN